MIEQIKTQAELKDLVTTSAYTITGAGGELEDWKKGYQELLQKEDIGKPSKWYTFKGKLMNDTYDLTGNNRYPDDITFLCFSLEGLHVGKLALFKIRMEDRWLDDIVTNNLNRENPEDTEE